MEWVHCLILWCCFNILSPLDWCLFCVSARTLQISSGCVIYFFFKVLIVLLDVRLDHLYCLIKEKNCFNFGWSIISFFKKNEWLLSSLSTKYFSLGIEGTAWSELIRTADQLDSMIFPRLLAVAERAWNKAPWADNAEYAARQRAIDSEWVNFANTLGYKELKRLDLMGVAYRIPPPEPRCEIKSYWIF